jgi:putative transposase
VNHYNPDIHHRRSIRLQDFDYTQPGMYFLTFCTQDMECLFGEVIENSVILNTFGEIAKEEWLKTPVIRKYVALGEFIIMPNHVHAMLEILDVGATRRVAPNAHLDQTIHLVPSDSNLSRATHRVAPTGPAPGSVGAIVGQFKSVVTKQINSMRNTRGISIWQRNYYEHVVRNNESLADICDYIINNPQRWVLDKENLDFILPPFIQLTRRGDPVGRPG